MWDINSKNKSPEENTQIPIPENITWIPCIPETVLSIMGKKNNAELFDKVKIVLRNTNNDLSIFFDYDKKTWRLKAKRNQTNIKLLESLYSEIYHIDIELFPEIVEVEYINQWDILQVKSDWIYYNWKPIFWFWVNL